MKGKQVMHSSFCKRIRYITAVFCVAAAVVCTFVPSFAAQAEMLTETVNLTRPQKNITGEGYYWDNRNSTLILQGVSIDTADDYGIKLPDGATVELRGNNRISARYAALAGQGGFTVTGDGTLTVSAENGIMSYSEVSKEIRIRSGNIDINAGSCGIRYDAGTVTVSGGKLDISVSDTDAGTAVYARNTQLTGGEFIADSPVTAERTVRLTAVGAEISAPGERAALSAGERIITEKVGIKTGSLEAALADADTYSGESFLTVSSTADRSGRSILLGDSYPRYADYLLIAGAVLVLVLIIGVPAAVRRRRTNALIRRLEAEKNGGMTADK